MPKLMVLIGFPAVGKSTYAQELEKQGFFILSGDRVIEQIRDKYGLASSDDVYYAHREELNSTMTKQLEEAIRDGKSIAVDAFNLTKRHRARPLDAVRNSPYGYDCSAVIFYPPEAEEHAQRLGQRVFGQGRMSMANGLHMIEWEESYEPPSKEEGFSEIRTLGKPPKEALMTMGR